MAQIDDTRRGGKERQLFPIGDCNPPKWELAATSRMEIMAQTRQTAQEFLCQLREGVLPAVDQERSGPMLRPLADKDGEVRELTADDIRSFKPIAEVDPGMVEAMNEFRRKVGRPKAL